MRVRWQLRLAAALQQRHKQRAAEHCPHHGRSRPRLRSTLASPRLFSSLHQVAQETHAYIRSWFVDNYSQAVADAVVIQYGGSVSAGNVDDLMACADIDGALVGGASLKGETFGPIINFKPK